MAEPRKRRVWLPWLAGVLGVLVFAYGFAVTEVDLDEIREEGRRDNLVRILRALARPEILEQDQEESTTDVEIMIPCTGAPSPVTVEGDRLVTVDPGCAEPRATIDVSGAGFPPNAEIAIFLIPESAVRLRLSQLRTDSSGAFSASVRLPNRPSDVPQTVSVVSAEPVGGLRWTQTARDTVEKIVETVFLALIATTFATLLAVPLSFLAARNLMEDVSSPLTNVALGLIAAPLGAALGAGAAMLIQRWGILILIVGAMVGLVLRRLAKRLVWVIDFLLILVALDLASQLLLGLGGSLEQALAGFGFFGVFLAGIGDLLSLGLAIIGALLGAGGLVMLASRLGHRWRRSLSSGALMRLNIPLATTAGALWAWLAARAIAWFYEWVDPLRTTWIPLAVGGLVGVLAALRSRRRQSLRLGLGVYYVTRTIFNALRALEPLILAIVFVIWVGIGPFAGALALALHTIAALAKLYSEQVESIAQGPIEAIKATGANRLQSVVYGVVPQIIPPYISFTMYRWDINVRMSTIIGFVGGGGIGFLLQQNINLLNYRAAAAQILAIAIVVASMDWLSSRIRARFV